MRKETNMSLEQITKTVMNSIDRVEKAMEDIAGNQRELAERLLQVEQRGSGVCDEPQVMRADPNYLSSQVVKEVKNNADLLSKTDKLRLEIKAAGDVVTTAMARAIASGGVGMPTGLPIGVQNAMPARKIDAVTAYEYSRYVGIEGAAARQAAEGDAKSPVRPVFSLINQSAITIAGYSKISKQALTDSKELERAIGVTLFRSISSVMDSELNSASWGGASGLLGHATAYTSLVYTGLADAASEAVATMQEGGFIPDTVVMRPAEWLAITTAKAAGSGEYLSGSYLSALPESLRGMRVVLSPTITAGKVLVVDSSQVELLVVDGFTVEIGTVDDDFTKNVRTILGEVRVLPTFRAVGAARLITPKA